MKAERDQNYIIMFTSIVTQNSAESLDLAGYRTLASSLRGVGRNTPRGPSTVSSHVVTVSNNRHEMKLVDNVLLLFDNRSSEL